MNTIDFLLLRLSELAAMPVDDGDALEKINALLSENKSLRDKLGEAEKVVDAAVNFMSDADTMIHKSPRDTQSNAVTIFSERKTIRFAKTLSQYKGGGE